MSDILRRSLQICILEHDYWALIAQFHQDGLEVLGCDASDDPAHGGTADEFDLSKAGVADDGFSHGGSVFARALNLVEAACWEACFGEDLKDELVSPWT